MIGIESDGAVNHQPEFAAACLGPSAEQAVSTAPWRMAWTAIDAATDRRLCAIACLAARSERASWSSAQPGW